MGRSDSALWFSGSHSPVMQLELFPGGIPSPLQHEGSQEEMHCLAGEPWRNLSTD